MPRGSRIDYPGLLHHGIVQGIERRKIFGEENGYKDFLGRIGRPHTRQLFCMGIRFKLRVE